MLRPVNQPSPVPTHASPPARLHALDALRGLTIAAMVVVNTPGSWSAIYPPLEHAAWDGCTPTDLIFPFFLFIMGCAMASSRLGEDRGLGERAPVIWSRVLRRALVLIALGLMLALVPKFDPSTIRFAGVLQRIGLCYLIATIAIATLRVRSQWIVCAVVLIAYALLLALIAAPGTTGGPLSPRGNIVAHIDRLILQPAHMYTPTIFGERVIHDPEGILSTLPSVVTTIVGFWVGLWVRRAGVNARTVWRLLGAGAMVILFGGLLHLLGVPINKNLWSSSFVIFTAGWATVSLALLLALYGRGSRRRMLLPFEILGLNAILVFVCSGLLARLLSLVQLPTGVDGPSIAFQAWVFTRWLSPSFGPLNGSLAYAMANLALWWFACWVLWRRRVFWKV